MMHKRKLAVLAAIAALAGATAVMAGPRDDILAGYAAEAGVTAFDAAAGKALFTGTHTGGKPETPSCTTCHTGNLTGPGKTRAGKVIEPMAVSANPQRFTDPAKVEKWFGRNCRSVLGRECSAKEKGDVITWLSSL
ncbi:DUF1924 domain-containing protein [Oricola nitratireducens]|jgi:mono/diheme cytochrome c family protein|uniref:DUF1924 domain-containing protein n=1 Tax=Oricola nitratireducens TaxID=2775868 RepID=UPI001AED9861|nr:DUF1924 domain-containing protein [Oricola nitratireducens]